MYGKKYWGVARTSFLIDPDGKITRIFHKVKPDTHSEQILAALTED
jgi:peroxiredoxin Q/BCP